MEDRASREVECWMLDNRRKSSSGDGFSPATTDQSDRRSTTSRVSAMQPRALPIRLAYVSSCIVRYTLVWRNKRSLASPVPLFRCTAASRYESEFHLIVCPPPRARQVASIAQTAFDRFMFVLFETSRSVCVSSGRTGHVKRPLGSSKAKDSLKCKRWQQEQGRNRTRPPT